MSKLMDKMAQSGLISLPKFITNSFSLNFPAAINPEWHHFDFGFEAVFQENGGEAIAQFNKYGTLTEVRRSISVNELPELISRAIENFGELMNLISVSKKNIVFYEIIYRNSQLNRFLLLIDSNGIVMQNEQL